MTTTFKRNLLISFAVSLLILIVSSVASYLSIRKLLETNRMVGHTQEVIYNIKQAEAVMLDAQTAMRGFLITGRASLLTDYQTASARTDQFVGKVEELTLDNPRQQVMLRKLRPLRTEFFSYLKLRIDERRNGKQTATFDLKNGTELMGRVRATMQTLENEEQRLLKIRSAKSEEYAVYSVMLIVVAAIIALIISGLFFSRILNDYNERALLYQQLAEKDRETAERIQLISGMAAQIATGNYGMRVDEHQKDALGTLGGALNNMASSLDQSFQTLSKNEWLQTGQSLLGKVMLGDKTTAELARDVVAFMAEYTDSQAGILYVFENGRLRRTAGYSYQADRTAEIIELGEGLAGEAVASQKMLEIKAPDDADLHIHFAMGEIRPAHVVALPLIEAAVEGVLELASTRPYPPQHLEFLNLVAGTIATALRASQNRRQLQELLEETQSQAEELKAQHSELESINAELEAQTEKLQASEEELKVQQEELQQTNEELSERSVLLEERNVEIQKKSEELELSTRYKSEFLANMSHELRTPLNSILLLSRLLSENNEGNLSPEQTEFARVIQSSGSGLLALIDEILDLSKIEAGKMEVELQDVAISEITDSLNGLFSEVARHKGIEFHIEIEPDAPVVIRTDRMRIEQILNNLISNAIKFTSEGSVTLQICQHPKNPKFVCFSVVDTGIGIPKEKQPLIFDAFQQADGSTKRKYGGTGLGLSISRELARLLKGGLSVSSKPGEGSTFSLRLPITGTTGNENLLPEEESQEEESKIATQSYLESRIPEDIDDDRNDIQPDDKVILIVEDDVIFARTLMEYAHQRGYKCVTTVRGDHAIPLALAHRPVGILLDLQLPVRNGWEVMEDLKQNPQTKHIPVHVISSHNVRHESLLKGAAQFVDKPTAMEQIPEVFRRIEHIVSRESQKVLIVEDNPKHAKALAYFLEAHSIKSEIKSDIDESIQTLTNDTVDCVILDMGIPDPNSYEVLENVKKNKDLESVPVIVFTGKSLSMAEEVKIRRYADSIVVKTAHSYQRMLDEVSLFLHLVEEKKEGRRDNARFGLLQNGLSGKTVLVVDDDVRNIYSLTKSLETLKMKVITAIDGKEALEVLEEHPETDIVLLDMMMPNMDGYEAAQEIRKIKRYKQLPIIAVTAKAMMGDREKCIRAGASDYITKPVDVDQLLSLLRVWLYDKK